jgi:hypothetical protein
MGRPIEWDRESATDAFWLWYRSFPEPPSSYAWSRTWAERRGGDALRRFRSGRWPSTDVISRLFGSWPAFRDRCFAMMEMDYWVEAIPHSFEAHEMFELWEDWHFFVETSSVCRVDTVGHESIPFAFLSWLIATGQYNGRRPTGSWWGGYAEWIDQPMKMPMREAEIATAEILGVGPCLLCRVLYDVRHRESVGICAECQVKKADYIAREDWGERGPPPMW